MKINAPLARLFTFLWVVVGVSVGHHFLVPEIPEMRSDSIRWLCIDRYSLHSYCDVVGGAQ